MAQPLVRLVIAATLAIAAAVSWKAADAAERLAANQERLATLQQIDSAPRSGWTAWLERLVGTSFGEAAGSRTPAPASMSDYWAARYDALLASDEANRGDPLSLLLSANAAFRKAQREAGARTPAVERLDQVLQAYAGVLKNGGFNRDAAYNYEYVARLRDAAARSKSPNQRSMTPRSPVAPKDDLPAGPTLHGAPGMHPPGARGEEFEIMTPMDYGEREAQPEATPGRPLPRKG